MRALTKKEKAEYVDSGYSRCPYCGSEDITGHSPEIDGAGASQEVTCEVCSRGWFDLYVLTDIIERREIKFTEPKREIDPI